MKNGNNQIELSTKQLQHRLGNKDSIRNKIALPQAAVLSTSGAATPAPRSASILAPD